MTHNTTPLTDREPSKTTREDLLFFSTLGCPPPPDPHPSFKLLSLTLDSLRKRPEESQELVVMVI